MPSTVLTIKQRFTPQFLLMRLRHGITAQDEASEALASSFVQQQPQRQLVDGPSVSRNTIQDVEDFVKEYREQRKIYHKRAMWAEKWGNNKVIWRDD